MGARQPGKTLLGTPVKKSNIVLLLRDAVFRVLAVEQPDALVLNYAPGPLDTPMIADLLADHRTDQGMVWMTSAQDINVCL